MNTQLSPLAQRMLGIIYAGTRTCSCLAGWHICDALGIDRTHLGCCIPATEHDAALKELIKAELVEEVPELGCRYRLKEQSRPQHERTQS